MYINKEQKKIEEQLNRFLPLVSKPSRYTGVEINAVKKDFQNTEARVALAFPDTYEIGMSYFGFQILYNILNKAPDVLAERVYAPWIDMMEMMRTKDIPLFTLESKLPVRLFDIIGFTFQYELHYATILAMLELSGLQVKSSGRNQTDPLIIGGGPCAFNPEPMAEFIDAFIIGDAEEAFTEICKYIGECKRKNTLNDDILKGLLTFDGVYIPRFYKQKYNTAGDVEIFPVDNKVPETVQSLIIPELKKEYLPLYPVIPSMKTVQERGNIEIMRGCTRGCRFCNAGFIYRPTREREFEDVIDYASEIVKYNGYREISLLSLSTSDYSELDEFMEKVMNNTSGSNISFSFPSLRADNFNRRMAEFARNVKKSGLTFAVEAGSERLRRVINKNISVEGLYKSAENAFGNGWRLLKLYFMIGLPTETDDDIIDIVNLTEQIIRIGKPYAKIRINLAVSPFVPKPFTPFQWMGQASIDELNRKTNLIRDSIRKRRLGKYINLKWRDPKISYLECVLGRGDRRLSDVIYTAYKNGAVFDGWTDQFRFDIWEKSLEDNGISTGDYLGEKSLESRLPWDHINKGVSKQFLKSELQKAFAGEYTDDCRDRICYNCGIADSGECVINKNRKKSKKPVFPDSYPDNIKEKEPEKSGKKNRIRIWFAKKGFARFLSHLDLSYLFSRGARMAETSIYYTKGFNPHPKISFGPALPTGYIGLNEYIDIITEEVPVIPEFIKKFQAALPLGITINNAEIINSEKEKTVSNSPKSAAYRVLLNSVCTQDDVKSLEKITLDDISDEMYILKKEDKKLYVKKYIEKIQYLADRKEIFIVIRFYNNGTLRVEDLLSLFMKGDKKLFLQCTIIRENIFF